jgi:hypothetical protein
MIGKNNRKNTRSLNLLYQVQLNLLVKTAVHSTTIDLSRYMDEAGDKFICSQNTVGTALNTAFW